MRHLYAKGAGDTQRKVKALPHQLDNEEVNAAKAAAVMRSRGAARAGSSMGRRWGHAEQSSSEECGKWIEACERLRAVRVIYPDSMPTDTADGRKLYQPEVRTCNMMNTYVIAEMRTVYRTRSMYVLNAARPSSRPHGFGSGPVGRCGSARTELSNHKKLDAKSNTDASASPRFRVRGGAGIFFTF